MKSVKRIFSPTLVALFVALMLLSVNPLAAEEIPYGPFPDKIIIFQHPVEATVVPMIERGEMDAWLYYLISPENKRKAEESPDVKIIRTYAGSQQLLVNPLETTNGFNPFSIREIREALNWLIDRRFIVNEIYRGWGVPRWTMFRAVSPDYSRIIEFARTLEAKYSYDFERAKTQIFEALSEAGAEYREGRWYYNDEPITINFLIRPEDERKDYGDYVASQLEALGFTVNKLYKTGGDAFRLWGVFEPSKRGEWHIYTAGWANIAITAYDDDTPWFWYSPDNIPLCQEYRGPPLLRDAMDKLHAAEYKSMEERNELVKKISELALWDGVHVWVIDQLPTFPLSAKMGDSVLDVYGAVWSFWFLRTMRGAEGTGGDVKLGNRLMFMEGFNTIAGFSWLYDVFTYYLVSDPSIFPHPHTGKYMPIRAEFTVATVGPEGKLDVPVDALIYDLSLGKFKQVGEGVKSASKVTFKFTLGKWHHGQPITKADILYSIAEAFKVASEESPLYDSVAATPGRVLFIKFLRGIKFTADDTMEVYIDYCHIDDSYIAAAAGVAWPDTPWELLVLMNEAVSRKELAWSVDMADIWGVDQLDLTKGRSIDILKNILDELVEGNYIPSELEDVVSLSDAAGRWSALKTFYEEREHFWVSNGPYIFDSADPTALQMTLEAFREYPFKANKWDGMMTIKIPSVRVTKAPEDIVPGLNATFNLAVEVQGMPYDRAEVKYLISDAMGNMLLSGTATPKGRGAFDIILSSSETGKMTPGTYSLLLIAIGEEAALPSTSSYTFMAMSEITYFERLVRATEADLRNRISTLETNINSLSKSVSDMSATLTSIQNTVNIVLALSAVALIVSVAAVVLSLRKK